ncbi:MST1 [Mytilus edulis]|uniref:MST1 n=1 Tax=Mytilus edulis TaxID=6550 RepID=A0A8S3S759_MYTED|nr:MST1 [Mytilus edulis]
MSVNYLCTSYIIFSDLDDDLVDNYCRNPGSGTKPWCYTHYEDCNRNYCDPCGLVSKVKCRSPPILYDVISTERIRRRYKVGDVVTFKCKTGIEIERRICLADGSWSGGNFVCGRCPNGWFPFDEKCYRLFDTYENMTLSNEICKRHSAVMTSTKDEDEFKFLLWLR